MEREENIEKVILDACGRSNPFCTPDGYFNDLHANICATSRLDAVRKDAFSVPENYWETLGVQLQSRIAIETNRYKGFGVPENYFTSLEQRILSQNLPQKRLPVVRRLFAGNAWKYASAACITLVLGVSLLSQLNTTSYSVQNELSVLPDGDIENYLEENTNSSEMNMLIENIDHDLNMKISSAQIDRKTLSDYIETQL